MFTQNQIAEFKEAFSFIDSDKDGLINKNDLAVTFDALGRLVKDDDLRQMLEEAPGPINFTMFLGIFGDKIAGKCSIHSLNYFTFSELIISLLANMSASRIFY